MANNIENIWEGKVEISDEKKEKILDKTFELAKEYGREYLTCGPTTFVAVCDAFRSEGIELMSPEVEEDMFRGMLGIGGGMATTGKGTCGSVTAGCFLISYVVGVGYEGMKEDTNLNIASSLPAVEYIIDRFEERYGSINCLRCRYNRVHRAFYFLDPETRKLEASFAIEHPEECGVFAESEENIRDHPAVKATIWTAEAIFDILNKEPEERREYPSELSLME